MLQGNKIKGGYVPGLPAAVAAAESAVLSLLTTANMGRASLATITPNLAAVLVFLAAGVATLRAGRPTVSYVHSYQVPNTPLRINYLTFLCQPWC